MTGRRRFLQGMAVSAAGAAVALAPGSRALARALSEPLKVMALTPQLSLISGAGGNVLALTGPQGVLLVDSGSAERTRDLMDVVAKLPGGRRVTTLFNTHWHWDHTGGNDAFRKAGAEIIAHENTRLWLGTTIWCDWQNRTYPPRAKAALPTRTFYKRGELAFGPETIEYGWLGQAHTDGDLYVFFRGQNVLAVGDVLAVGQYPVMDTSTGGWIGGLRDATEKLTHIGDEKTQIVPGSGPVQTRADLAAEHEMLASLQQDLWQMARKGWGADDMIAHNATAKYDARWGKPDEFIASVYRGFTGHLRELGGVV
ncbi:MAG TPA: MBL fold metallo-hydrolase [Steroidobacteraceae bacterium]|nr:MBL fold metallo-hydrolase [Steroidobacteraceae bacterium]